MHFFGKKKTQPVATPIVATTTIPENHVSKKKKNTYTITFSTFFDATLFSMCKNTPLGVVTLNGKQIQDNSGWISCTEFPNPCATRMATIQHLLAEALGTKISTQIIEYLDKDTGAPVCQLYPHALHIFDEYKKTYLQHLNHASRRDLAYQIKQRQEFMNRLNAMQR